VPILAVFESVYYQIPRRNQWLYYALAVIGMFSALVVVAAHTIGLKALKRDI
jgi:hypothetical protein